MARKTFTELVRQLFINSGCSQAELRKATGIDRATISRFVSGRQFLSPDTLDKVAEYLGWEPIVKRKKRDG